MRQTACRWLSLGMLLGVTPFLSGCVSLSALWPFHKQTPLQAVSTTERQLTGVVTQLGELQKQVEATHNEIHEAQSTQWAYVAQMSKGVQYALTRPELTIVGGAVPALLNENILNLAQTKSPLPDAAVADIKSVVDGLYSPLKARVAAAEARVGELTNKVAEAQKVEEAAVVKAADMTTQSGQLQVRVAMLGTKLTAATDAAIKADDVKTQALAGWNHLKWWFIGTAAGIVILVVISHLHLSSFLK